MRTRGRNLIVGSFVLFALATPAWALDSKTEIDFSKLQQWSKGVAESKNYQEAMALLRKLIREKLFPNLWKKSQENPQFQLGAVHFSELFQRLEKFNLFQNDSEFTLQAEPDRKSDFYVQDESWGVVNIAQMRALEGTKAMLVLPFHIFLGASGYRDENYQFVLALLLLEESLNPTSALRNLEISQLLPQTNQALYREKPQVIAPFHGQDNKAILLSRPGGFTGVGGGGDGLSLLLKIEMLSKYLFVFANSKGSNEECFKKWSQPLSLARDVLHAQIESSNSASKVEVDRNSEGQWRVLVPAFDVSNEKQLQAILQSSMASLCLLQRLNK